MDKQLTHKLKLIGYWNNLLTNTWIHPRLLIDKEWETENRDKIIKYLRNSMDFSYSFGLSPNRFFRGPKHMGDHEKTDGVWVWPSGLADYGELYHIRLPNQFLNHMKKLNFTTSVTDINDIGNYEVNDQDEIDLTFWEEWCKNEKKKVNYLLRLILNFSLTL